MENNDPVCSLIKTNIEFISFFFTVFSELTYNTCNLCCYICGRKVILFDQCNLIQCEKTGGPEPKNFFPNLYMSSWLLILCFFVTVVLHVNLVWLSVLMHACVCVCVSVRLFSGLSNRSLRCLADFYAVDLINGWEMLYPLSWPSSPLYQHMTWNTHALTSTHTHNRQVGTESPSDRHSILPVRDAKYYQSAEQSKNEIECRNTLHGRSQTLPI